MADLRRRSTIDPLTGCWHWQGAKAMDGSPRIWTFDHKRGEKRSMSGPKAVWNIAHGVSPEPMLVYRRCVCADCVHPVHMARARDKTEIGLHVARNGKRKGKQLESKRANVRLAHLANGVVVTPPEIVLAVWNAPRTISGVQLAERHDISSSVVSSIRRGRSHRHLTVEAA